MRTGRRLRLALLVVPALAAAALVVLLLRDGDPGPIRPLGPDAPEPFAEMDAEPLERRAADGVAHVLYEKSPGGALASAARTARWRGLVERAAGRADVDPDLLEAMVLLESAGRPNVVAGSDLEAAAGLAQILAETGRDFLGMRVEVEQSERLSRAIAQAEARGERARASRLRAARRRVDERFDPARALAGAGRYLRIATERFGREDLAVVSYHMGIGNLEQVLRAFAGEEADDEIAEVVEDGDLRYARVFFESAPDSNPESWKLLAGLGDDSSTYLWRVLAAREIMRLWRRDRGRLQRVAALHTAKASAEEVLHPEDRTELFEDAEELEAAYARGELRPLPDRPSRLGLRADPGMGRLTDELRRPRSLYRGLRPAALGLAAWMGRRVRELSSGTTPLSVTAAVRDRAYQRLLGGGDHEARRGYSLHTAGLALDVLRRYPDRGQAEAFQFVLDRLQVLNLIAWGREPEVIHIAVSDEGRSFLPVPAR